MLSKKALEKLNVFSPQDLLYHYPSRYQDLTRVETGTIVSSRNLYTRTGKTIQKIIIRTKFANKEITYFNQPYLVKTLKPGVKISFSGNEYEINGPLIHTGRLVPIYPETKGISSKMLRRQIWNLLQKNSIVDWLPDYLKLKYQLINLNSALQKIHFPKNQADIDQAKKRLAFDELFLFKLNSKLNRQAWLKQKSACQFELNQEKILQFIGQLPFSLTSAQNRCLKEILTDLSKKQPMNRLLQGDVGSGKTVLAAIAMYLSFLNGFKSALMAPTEVLTQQHYLSLKTMFKNTGLELQLITSNTKPKTLNPKANIYIGTHALLFKKIPQLGLLVIDEQHRFGVKQRSQLLTANKITPHLLTMTATPIPRTLALTIYNDLNLSTLDELPPGRQPVKTWLVSEAKRLDAYHWISQKIATESHQAFIVYPLIDPSESETLADVKAATAEFEALTAHFKDFRLGLVHGRLNPKQKNQLLDQFRKHELDILVATPVIEVGIDIPGASIMIIENSDRFGLAQLHQLRGRIGRNHQASFCFLFTQNKNPEAIKRLKYLETLNSGIKLAEIDLKLRGPGSLQGFRQHGFFNFKLATLTDLNLINSVQSAVSEINRLTPALKNRLKEYKIHSYATSA